MNANDKRLFEYTAVWIASQFLYASTISLTFPSLSAFQNYTANVILGLLASSLTLAAYHLVRCYLPRTFNAIFNG